MKRGGARRTKVKTEMKPKAKGYPLEKGENKKKTKKKKKKRKKNRKTLQKKPKKK